MSGNVKRVGEKIGICINSLLRENAENDNEITVWIDPERKTVTVKRFGYSTFQNKWITEDVENLEMSRTEIETLLILCEVIQ